MDLKLHIDQPSGICPLVDYRRDLDVSGRIEGDVKEDMILKVELLDEKGNVLRFVHQDKKDDRNVYTEYEGLTSYEEKLDPKKEKLKDFGFPELQVKNLNDPEASLRDASIKCFYNDKCFKALIVSGSDVKHGRIMDTGIGYVDENGDPYSVIGIGKYTIRVTLSDREGRLLSQNEKEIMIGIRDEVVLVRFNPVQHKQRMIAWCEEMGFTIINDTLPGYLEPYLGRWYYHMGLLPYYRSNDIAIYQDCMVHMFVYLCDPTSTSYETELAYLQEKGRVCDPDRFKAYHYDIGEAFLGKGRPYERTGKIVPFADGEDMALYRVDIVGKDTRENAFDLSEKDLKYTFCTPDHIAVEAGSDIAFCGVVKPWQLDKKDVTLKEDNTYSVRHDVSQIRYTMDDGDEKKIEYRGLLMERIDEGSIGASVYEFYNLFHVDRDHKGKRIIVSIEALNDKGRICDQKIELIMDVL